TQLSKERTAKWEDRDAICAGRCAPTRLFEVSIRPRRWKGKSRLQRLNEAQKRRTGRVQAPLRDGIAKHFWRCERLDFVSLKTWSATCWLTYSRLSAPARRESRALTIRQLTRRVRLVTELF